MIHGGNKTAQKVKRKEETGRATRSQSPLSHLPYSLWTVIFRSRHLVETEERSWTGPSPEYRTQIHNQWSHRQSLSDAYTHAVNCPQSMDSRRVDNAARKSVTAFPSRWLISPTNGLECNTTTLTEDHHRRRESEEVFTRYSYINRYNVYEWSPVMVKGTQ